MIKNTTHKNFFIETTAKTSLGRMDIPEDRFCERVLDELIHHIKILILVNYISLISYKQKNKDMRIKISATQTN